jgi:hypothetical protein
VSLRGHRFGSPLAAWGTGREHRGSELMLPIGPKIVVTNHDPIVGFGSRSGGEAHAPLDRFSFNRAQIRESKGGRGSRDGDGKAQSEKF